jgi:hypothetical protein
MRSALVSFAALLLLSACGGRTELGELGGAAPEAPGDSGIRDSGVIGVDTSFPPPPTFDSSFPPPTFDSGPLPPPPFDATVDVVPPPPQSDGCVIPPGGQSCTPGVVACGSNASCKVPAEECCLMATGSGACLPAGAKCPGGLPVACAEASDCPAGDICCLVVTTPSVTGVAISCQPSCSGGIFSLQICRSDTECPNGQCIAQNCSLGGGSLTVEACGLIPQVCTPAM